LKKQKEYSNRPEVKKRQKKYSTEYYSKPGVKKHIREYHKGYYSRPEVIKHKKEQDRKYREKNKKKLSKQNKEYRNRPKVKERKIKLDRDYRNKPENKEREKIRDAKKRGYGDIILIPNVYSQGMLVDGHHLLNNFYIPNIKDDKRFFMCYLPHITHTFIGGSAINRMHWTYNAEAIKKYFRIDVKDFFGYNEK